MGGISNGEEKESGANKNQLINRDRISINTALTLMGFTLYGAVRFGQLSFYSALGMTPEDVGMTFATTIARAICAFVGFGAGLALCVWATWLFSRGTLPALLGALVLAYSGSFFLTFFTEWDFKDWFRYAVIALAALSVAGFVIRCGEIRARRVMQSVRKQRMALLTTVILLPPLVIAYAVWSGIRAAEIVQNGELLEEVTGYGGFLGVETRYVQRFEALKAEFKKSECSDAEEKYCSLIYLGVNQGIYYLYDFDKSQVLRIPISLVRIDTLW
ncbi:hypothetical protein [Streptomyces sp. NPDC029041]|uniref:hypothetical protein n=1 Tax=Streptomyces sp. NPDC029041 TaxID=3155727 RepID=UPI0033C6B8E3